MYLPPASAPPSWSHLCEQAEQAQPYGLCTSTHERLLLGNLKTLGDWGCLSCSANMGRVKRRGGGVFEVKRVEGGGLRSPDSKKRLDIFFSYPNRG